MYWRTARDPGELQAYIVDLALADAAQGMISPTAMRSGFLLLYAISDALGADGGCFSLDVSTGKYRRIAAMPVRPQPVSSSTEGEAGDVEEDIAS